MKAFFSAIFFCALAILMIAIVKLLFIPHVSLASPEVIVLLEVTLIGTLLAGLILAEVRVLVKWFRTEHEDGHAFPMKEAAFVLFCVVVSALIWMGFMHLRMIDPQAAQAAPIPH